MRRWLPATFVAVGAVVAAGCGSSGDDTTTPPVDDSGYDSAVDSTTPPPDSGVDNGVDSGTDSTVADSGVDTNVDTGIDAGDADAAIPASRTTPTNGGAMAISKDDTIGVAANRTAGSVSIFTLKFGDATAPITKKATLAVGAEPWSVVIGNDDDTAYVVLRKDQKVVRIKGLKSTPTLDTASAATGSEPTGIAISPTGAKLYVANWAEGTVTVINTADMSLGTAINLNATLASSGFLGSSVTARAGLAHPRSLVITNNGDASDSDESIYVTEFYSQARTSGVPTDDSQFDLNRQGVVYRVKLSDSSVSAITIAPVAVTGFKDSNGVDTGCFPNQLFAIALNNGRAYVTANCASPRGPVGPIAGTPPNLANFKTEVHAAIFVLDVASNAEVPAQGLLLPKKFSDLYDTKAIDDTSTDPAVFGKRRNPLLVNDIAFATGSHAAYVTAYGSDAVFRIAYKDDGTLLEVGSAAQNFINVGTPGATGVKGGNLPVGIASANTGVSTVPFALVNNENSRNVSVLSFATQDIIAAADSEAGPPAVDTTKPSGSVYDVSVNKGRKFFATGLGRWSVKGQGWNSCESCHPDGLTDNVTWFFARGPRQTISLDGTYDPKDPTHRRILNWSGIFDEVHDFEGNVRGNSGGLGALVWQNSAPPGANDRLAFDGTAPTGTQKATTNRDDGLNGSTVGLMPTSTTTACAAGATTCDVSAIDDWNNLDNSVKFIRAPRGLATLDAAAVTAGKALFTANNCAACHGGSQWTLSRVFYAPGETNNNATTGKLVTTNYTAPTLFPTALNPPTNNAGRAATYRFAPFAAANDQINCILRDVGTFATGGGVAPTGVTLKETRTDMTTTAQGATGFNIPSLLGLVTGAPYYHAGNARTLEEAFSTTFAKHQQAHSTLFAPTATEIAQLVAFLSSIDESTAAIAIPATLGFNPDLCGAGP